MNEKQDVQKLRLFYMENPPEGMSKKDIQNMSDNDLLDMDYFLNEDINEIFDLEDEN
jgi:hypothetical protein